MLKNFIQNKLAILVYLVFILLFFTKILGSFSGFIFGYADTAHWNYNAYYFSKYLDFNGLYVTIDLQNNESFYPIGTVQSFQSWGLEKDILNFLAYKIWGLSGFLKIYAFVSISLSYFGFYFLLRTKFSVI